MLSGKRTIILGLVVLALAVVGIVSRDRRPTPVATARKESPTPRANKPVARAPSVVSSRPPPAPATAPTPGPPPATKEFSQEQLRNLAIRGFQETRLRMAAFRAHLEFTPQEHEKMLDELIDFKHAAAVVDAPLARVVSFDGNALVIEIPAHPTEGAAVRTALAQQIGKDFPAERAEQIVAGLDSFADLFNHFGQLTMTYTVERPRPDNQIHVITRAAAPDPSDTAATKKADALSGAGWMSRELLEMDDEVLIKTIDTYFPKTP